MTVLGDLFDRLREAARTGTVVLDRRSLPSRQALLLFDRLLGTEVLVVDSPKIERDGQTARLSGRITVLGIDHCSAVAAFAMSGADLAVTLTLFPPASWSLPQSFPALLKTGFAMITLSDVELSLATHDDAGAEWTVRHGLRLTGTAAAGAMLPGLGPILGRLANVRVSGPVRFARPLVSATIDAGETAVTGRLTDATAPLELILAAPLPVDLSVPGVSLSDLSLVLEGPMLSALLPVADVRRGIRGRIVVAGKAIDLYGGVTQAGLMCLRAEPEDLILPGLSDLAGLLPDTDLMAWLPPGFGSLGAFRITRLDLDLNLKKRSIAFLGVGLGQSVWSALEGQISLAKPCVYLMVSRPAEKTRRITCAFGGELTLDGVTVAVEAYAPDFVFRATLPEMPLSRLIAAHLPDLVGMVDVLPAINLREVAIVLSPRTGEMSFRAESKPADGADEAIEVPPDWILPIGVAPLGVRDVVVEINRRPAKRGSKAKIDGIIAGVLQVAGASFEIAYAFPGDFVLRGQVPTLSFSPLLQAVAGTNALRDLPLPPRLIDLTLTDVYVAIAPHRRCFSLAATTPIGMVEIVLQKATSGAWGCAMGIAASPDMKFANLDPNLAGLDALALDKITLILATTDDGSLQLSTIQPGRPDVRLNGDAIASAPPRPLDVRVHRGLNLFTTISLVGTGADEVLGSSSLTVFGSIGPSIADITLEAALDGEIHLAEGVTLSDIGFLLRPGPSNFTITLRGVVRALINGELLKFTGGLEVQPRGAALQTTMQGMWVRAFGVDGLDISDIALDLGLSFAPPLPSVGLAGTLRLGDFRGAAAVRFDTMNPARSMLRIAFDRLSLLEIVTTFGAASQSATLPRTTFDILAQIGFENVEIHVAPLPTRIGELTFEQGVRAAGRLVLPDFAVTVAMRCDPARGISASGSMAPIDLAGLFSIGGNEAGRGPEFSLRLIVGEPFGMTVDGRASLLGIVASVHVELSQTGFEFTLSGPVYGVFRGTITARGGQLGSSVGFMLSVRMDSDLLDFLAEQAGRFIATAADDAAKRISSAQATLDAEQRRLAAMDTAIAAARRSVRHRNMANLNKALGEVARWGAEVARLDEVVQRQRNAAEAGRVKAQNDMRAAAAEVERAQAVVNGLQQQITEQKNWIHELEFRIAEKKRWVDSGNALEKFVRGVQFSAFAVARGTEITAAYGKIGVFEASRGTAWGVLEGARQLVAAAQSAANKRFDELNLSIQGPLAARKAAQLALDGVNGTLQQLRYLTTDPLIDLDPEVSGLLAMRQGGTLALTAAQQSLEGTAQALKGIADAGEFIARNGIGALVDVRSAAFECSLQEGLGGKVELDLVVGFMKQPPQSLRMAFDFHDPMATASRLALSVGQ